MFGGITVGTVNTLYGVSQVCFQPYILELIYVLGGMNA